MTGLKILRKFLRPFLYTLLLAASALTAVGQTVTVTSNVKTMFGGNATTKTKVCFSLVDGAGYQLSNPRIISTGNIVPTSLQCFTPDVNGLITTPIYANDQISNNGATDTSIYIIEYQYNGMTVHSASYHFKASDITEDLNTKTPLVVSPAVLPPSGDATYARLDGGNMPFSGPVTAAKINLIWYANQFANLSTALTTICSNGAGTLVVPNGTYPVTATLSIANGNLCKNLNIVGLGSGQGDSVTCPVTITYNQTSGHLFDLTGVNDFHISNLCITDIAAAGAVSALYFNSSQRNTANQLYISGPWAKPIQFHSSSTNPASTIWNFLSNIHTTGTAIGGIGCAFDASDAVAKVINNNYLFNVACTGGLNGVGINFTGSAGIPVINENEIHSGEITTSNSGGTGVNIDPNSVRDLLIQNGNIEGNGTKGVVIGAGNTGIIAGTNISSNATNSFADNVSDSSVGGITWGRNNIGGVITQAYIDPTGQINGRSFCIGAAACDPGNINYLSGTAQEVSGGVNWYYMNAGPRYGSGKVVSWSSTVDGSGAADTGASRIAANVTGFGNGTAGDVSGEVRSAKISATYNAAGTVQTGVHIVQDTCTLGTNCVVTLSSSAAFTSSSSYHCTATDTTATNAVRVNQTAGNAVTFTGTGTDVINYQCIGN